LNILKKQHFEVKQCEKIHNLDFVSTEIVRALSSSIGLILATPLTAVFASLLLSFVE
jgi:uncharacterized membrane protein